MLVQLNAHWAIIVICPLKSFLFSGSFRESNRNSKGSKKIRSSGVEEGLTILVFEGHGGGGVGVEHLEFPKARGS